MMHSTCELAVRIRRITAVAGFFILGVAGCGGDSAEGQCAPGDLDCTFVTPGTSEEENLFSRDGGCLQYGSARRTGTIPDELVEASGLVGSAHDTGRLWSHNDSNNPAELFAIGTDGRLLAKIDMAVGNRDWEDISRGPCDGSDSAWECLYLGEIGDNRGSYDWIEVYRFREPVSLDGVRSIPRSEIEIMRFRYEDGPRDAEAMWVDGTGNVWIATKEPGGLTRLYTLPFLPTTPEQVRTASFVDQFLLTDVLPEDEVREEDERVTAGDFNEATGRVILRTNGFAFEFSLGGRPMTRVFDAPVRVVPAADEPQGEAIAYGPRGGYYHTSENGGADMYYVPCED